MKKFKEFMDVFWKILGGIAIGMIIAEIWMRVFGS